MAPITIANRLGAGNHETGESLACEAREMQSAAFLPQSHSRVPANSELNHSIY